MALSPALALLDSYVEQATRRGIITVDEADGRIHYHLKAKQSYNWHDPEEWVRALSVAYLVVAKGYPSNRIRLEVIMPARTPSNIADIVVYSEDTCKTPYIVVECKRDGIGASERLQAHEQLFGNANSLRAAFGLYVDGSNSDVYDIAGFGGAEREENHRGNRDSLPESYGDVPDFIYITGSSKDIAPVPASELATRIRKAHNLIWAGGKRDPLLAFDEWSKLLFAKVLDERTTLDDRPRRFQVGTKETTASVANRIHDLFAEAARSDPSIFSSGTKIGLSDDKLTEVVRTIQPLSFTRTDIDTIGQAFEQFFGSVFRGGLGQYFTMRQLSRFSVAMLNIEQSDYVLDPSAGSGGFLLEALLYVWHSVDKNFRSRTQSERDRAKTDFALSHVFGIEIHELLSRICKINLLLHHDGHTNIEASRSCLDAEFDNPRLNPPRNRFTVIVGNPPFGTRVKRGDADQLGTSTLDDFELGSGQKEVESEQLIIERCIQLLEPGGRFGLVLPDGVLNNAGRGSNCPQTRAYMARHGYLTAIVSLPDHAFRRSGAQNKTSIVFFRKFTASEKARLDHSLSALARDETAQEKHLAQAYTNAGLDYHMFLAEANHVGYTPSGVPSARNDLYSGDGPKLSEDQTDTILGDYQSFLKGPSSYNSDSQPSTLSVRFSEVWNSHSSHRLDPKFLLFQREEPANIPDHWESSIVGEGLMRYREDRLELTSNPDRVYQVMTISQKGEIRAREAGKGRNPDIWNEAYFAESTSKWYRAFAGDVVYSSIDLWKGCIAVVPPEFDGALVTSEFPILEILDHRLRSDFLRALLRTRWYQRAFRAITTGHSNRRRTQPNDFLDLRVSFPPIPSEQGLLTSDIEAARSTLADAELSLHQAVLRFSDLLDGRGDEELPDIDDEPVDLE